MNGMSDEGTNDQSVTVSSSNGDCGSHLGHNPSSINLEFVWLQRVKYRFKDLASFCDVLKLVKVSN